MARKLKILLISNLYPPFIIGGAEIVVSHLAEYLVTIGHDVYLLTTIGKEELTNNASKREVINGVNIIRIFPKNKYWLYDKKNVSMHEKIEWHVRDAWNFDTANKVRGIIEELKPDIVHTHNIDGFSPIVWKVIKDANLPLVHTAHDYHLLCPRSTLLRSSGEVCLNPAIPCKIFNQWNSKKTSFIDLFVSPSKFVIDQHLSMGSKPKKTKVIRNGIPNIGICSENQNENSKLAILYMGQLTKHKGLKTLLDAFSSLDKNAQVILNIAGKGQLEDEIVKYAKNDKRIVYHGFIRGEYKERLLNSSDIIVLPSLWYENAPISIIEAFNVGMVVITSNMGGLPELIDHMDTGLIFEAGNSEELAIILNKLISEPTLVDSLKNNAKKLGEYYSVDRMTHEYLDAYYELLKK